MLLSVSPAGSEFRVNTITADNQKSAVTAMDGDGDFVVAWFDESSLDVHAQRYNTAGLPQGGEFTVNTAHGASRPAIALDSDGDFMVVWEHDDGYSNGIYGQRYNAAAIRQGANFHVNAFTTNSQGFADVAIDANGDFVVTWDGRGGYVDYRGIFARRFNANGVPQGTEFRVNTSPSGGQTQPVIAMDAAGDFAVAWDSYAQDGSGYGVYARRYSVVGFPQADEFRVNTYTTGRQENPAVAMDSSGDFVIAWTSYYQAGANRDIYAQRYDTAGAPQGSEYRVNDNTSGFQFDPAIAMNSAGDFVVAWTVFPNIKESYLDIYSKIFDADGLAQGTEFRVNTFTAGNHATPEVSRDASGDFAVVWQSYGQDGSGSGVYAQRYHESVDSAGPTVAGLFVNGGRILPYGSYAPNLNQLVVGFSENVTDAGGSGGANSVTNPNNWGLTRNGLDLSASIAFILHSLRMASTPRRITMRRH